MGDELKPCPFCGGKVWTKTNSPMGWPVTYLLCGKFDNGSDGCGAVVSFRPSANGSLAAAAWNRRAQAQGGSDG